MEGLLGIGGIFGVLLALYLIVCAVLIPHYVYRTAQNTDECRKTLKKMLALMEQQGKKSQ